MQDELASRGLSVNTKRLGEIFGIPFIPATATQGEGTKLIKEARARYPDVNFRITPPIGQHRKIRELFLDFLK